MNAVQQQKDYYEKYWTSGRAQYSGDNQGYAANLRSWMHAQLRNLAPRFRAAQPPRADEQQPKCDRPPGDNQPQRQNAVRNVKV